MFQQKTFKTYFFLFFALFVLWALMMQPVAFAAEGKLVFDTIHSPALEGNLLGDSADRSVIVYLPPSYETSPEKRYPVVYLLHGYTMQAADWTPGGGTYGGFFSILPGLNKFMTENQTREMILVMPDAYNKYQGSCYANSSVTGNWEEFITAELAQYIDTTYRTLPQVASRGIAGYSMGGLGTRIYAIKHPSVYGAMYSLSGGGPLEGEVYFLDKGTWRTTLSLKNIDQFSGQPIGVKAQIAIAAAFSPNPKNPPFFADFPFELVDGEVRRVEAVYQKWELGFDVVALARTHQANLRKLRGIRFGWGKGEAAGIELGRANSQVLTELGIPHVFEEYEGGHTDNLNGRVETKVLPFFSDALAFEMLPVVAVQPRGKLATTWGEMKRR